MSLTNINVQQNIKGNKRWLYVFLGILIMMCLGTVYSWSVFRISVEKLYNIGSAQSGLPYMTSLAFYALFMLLTGKYIDKYSPRLIVFIGGLLVGGGWILSGFAQNIYILVLTYGVITGAGVGIVYGVPMSVVAKWFPEKKGLIVGFVLIGFGLSPFITAPIARSLIEAFGIMKAFQILGLSFIVIIPTLSYSFSYPSKLPSNLETSIDEAINLKDVSTKTMIKSKSFKGLYSSFMLGTMIGLMIIGMTSNVGIELIKLTPRKVTLFMSLFAVFNGIGRPVFGWLTDKLSQRKAMLLSYVLIAFAAVLMIIAKEGSISLYIIAFSIFWFNLGGWLAIAPASTLGLYGTKYYSQNYGVVFTAYGIGAIVGVYTSGMLKDTFGSYQAVFYFIIAACIVGILLSQSMIRNKQNEKRSQEYKLTE